MTPYEYAFLEMLMKATDEFGPVTPPDHMIQIAIDLMEQGYVKDCGKGDYGDRLFTISKKARELFVGRMN